MLEEFAHTPFELVIDLDTYDGHWSHVARFRDRSGWLRVVRATIQSEQDMLRADLIAACDEWDNPIPAWQAIHLTECCWSRLMACPLLPPEEVLDDILCEEEGALYARWQREMHSDVAAVATASAVKLEAFAAKYDYALAHIEAQLRSLRRARLRESLPELRIEISAKMRDLEIQSDQLTETFAAGHRKLRLAAEAAEEALWRRDDVLVEFEDCFTVQWRAEASILHSRRTLYDGPLEPVQIAKTERKRVRFAQPANAVSRFAHSAPTLTPDPGHMPIRRFLPEAAQLLQNLRPLLAWAQNGDSFPTWVTGEILLGCQSALVAEDLRLLGQQADPQFACPLRAQIAKMLQTIEIASRCLNELTAAEQGTPEIEGEEADLVVATLSAEERSRLELGRSELSMRIKRLERTLAALKPMAPRKAGYAAQLKSMQADLALIDEQLKQSCESTDA